MIKLDLTRQLLNYVVDMFILQEIVLHKPRSKRLLLMSQMNLNFLIIK